MHTCVPRRSIARYFSYRINIEYLILAYRIGIEYIEYHIKFESDRFGHPSVHPSIHREASLPYGIPVCMHVMAFTIEACRVAIEFDGW